jgi:hypothetical protein
MTTPTMGIGWREEVYSTCTRQWSMVSFIFSSLKQLSERTRTDGLSICSERTRIVVPFEKEKRFRKKKDGLELFSLNWRWARARRPRRPQVIGLCWLDQTGGAANKGCAYGYRYDQPFWRETTSRTTHDRTTRVLIGKHKGIRPRVARASTCTRTRERVPQTEKASTCVSGRASEYVRCGAAPQHAHACYGQVPSLLARSTTP